MGGGGESCVTNQVSTRVLGQWVLVPCRKHPGPMKTDAPVEGGMFF